MQICVSVAGQRSFLLLGVVGLFLCVYIIMLAQCSWVVKVVQSLVLFLQGPPNINTNKIVCQWLIFCFFQSHTAMPEKLREKNNFGLKHSLRVNSFQHLFCSSNLYQPRFFLFCKRRHNRNQIKVNWRHRGCSSSTARWETLWVLDSSWDDMTIQNHQNTVPSGKLT